MLKEVININVELLANNSTVILTQNAKRHEALNIIKMLFSSSFLYIEMTYDLWNQMI